jgi:glycine cleavage system H protein
MALLRGCDFPDTLLYHPDSHLWFAPAGDSLYRVGVTQFGIALSGEILLFCPSPSAPTATPAAASACWRPARRCFRSRRPSRRG